MVFGSFRKQSEIHIFDLVSGGNYRVLEAAFHECGSGSTDYI